MTLFYCILDLNVTIYPQSDLPFVSYIVRNISAFTQGRHAILQLPATGIMREMTTLPRSGIIRGAYYDTKTNQKSRS